jgi:regulator of protease activity HflC (stomatin/prohibitin superfamily)
MDPTKLPQRVVNAVQVQLRAALQGQKLRDLLRESEGLVQSVREGLRRPEGLPSLGLELVSLAILAIKPTPDTARALEATIREQILKDADDALYLRRNARKIARRVLVWLLKTPLYNDTDWDYSCLNPERA